MHVLVIMLRLVVMAAGCLLCYVGLFLYEAEERKLQNSLEEWWVRINDMSSKTLSWHVALMKAAAGLATAFLDRLFGKRMLSVQAIAVSGCLSFVSLFFANMLLSQWPDSVFNDILTGKTDPALYFQQNPPLLETIIQQFVARAIVFRRSFIHGELVVLNVFTWFALAGIAASILTHRLRHVPVLVFSVFILGTAITLYTSAFYSLKGHSWGTMSLAIFLGVFCDVGALLLTRRIIRLQTMWNSFPRLFGAAGAELMLSCLLLIGPLIVGTIFIYVGIEQFNLAIRYIADTDGLLSAATRVSKFSLVGSGIVLSATTNMFSAALALTLFASLILLVIHRMIWPVIDRLVYRLARLGLLRWTPPSRQLSAVLKLQPCS